MFAKPQPEHAWLQQLVGEWIVEAECKMAPDQPWEKSISGMRCRMIGGLWLVAENEGNSPDGNSWSSILTLGYDPLQNCYVGTFIASMMTHLWLYRGVLDPSGKKLPLDSHGPSMDGTGTAQYCDTIEIVDAGHWIFSGSIRTADGTWQPLMISHQRRA